MLNDIQLTGKANSILNSDVIIIGEFPWPHGSAAANILHGHCKAIKTAGFSVSLLPSRPLNEVYSEPDDKTYTYNGISYRCLGSRAERSGNRIKHFISHHFLGSDPRISWLEKQNLKRLRAIIAYPGVSGSSSWLLRLKRLCRKKKIKLLVHVVEWHDPDHYQGGRWGLSRWDGEMQRRVVNKHCDGVICISRHLHHYYEKHVTSVCIPPILDYDTDRWQRNQRKSNDDKVRILFSGTPKRERHDLLLEALFNVRKHYPNLFLEYLGASRVDIVGLNGVTDELISKLEDGVHFHGRVPDNMVDSIISSASFGIVCREKAHWSNSCFPSKVTEFLGFGVPMIYNSTSDLDRYLNNGVNAIRIESLTSVSIEDSLSRVAGMRACEREQMSQNAKKLSRCFNGSKYADGYRKLLR